MINTIIGVEIVKQLFKFGGSFRKEAITVAIAPTVVSLYNSMEQACSESCTLSQAIFAPDGNQWAAFITAIVALTVHLNAKRNEAK